MNTLLKRKSILVSIQLILFVTPFVQTAIAQNYVDILKLNYNNTSQNAFENSDKSTRVEEFDLETTIPIVINETSNFVTGFIVERIQTKLYEDGNEETFSSICLKIGLNKTHSAKWSGTYLLLPKIASDFKHITKKDFQLGGAVLLKYTKNEFLQYKVGIYSNSELFGPWIVPILGLYYLNQNRKVEANVTLPFSAEIHYSVHPNIAIGINYFGQVRSYHLNEIPSSEKKGYVARSSNELSGSVKFNLTKGIILQTKVGHSIGRFYRVYDEDDKIKVGFPLLYIGDNRQQLNTDFADGWIYQVMVIYRFKRNK